jgi:hypothetical protein
MRILYRFMALTILGLGGSLAHADTCQSWTHTAYPVTMEACSYPNGGSGYYKITNNGSQPAAICWTIVTNDGRELKGCNSSLDAGESSSGSCSSCGAKNSGVRHILLNKFRSVR